MIKINNNRNKYNILDLTEKEIKNEFDGYYVYAHIYIPTNEVYYVGKGCRRRCCSFNRREYYDLQDDIEIEILARFSNEQLALDFEKMEIFYYKYIGQCKYNDSQFYGGKRRGEIEMNEIAIGTEVEEIEDIYGYSYHNEFEQNKDIKFENVQLNAMELNMTRGYRNNVENFMSNLSEMSYEEVESMYTLAKQNLEDGREDDMNLIHTYRIICKHLKKYF